MLIEELLTEQSRAPLYHAMGLQYAEMALKNNQLLATTTQRFWPDGKRRKDNDPEYQGSYWMKGLSLTRDRQYAAGWNGVILVLDQDKLKDRYKLVPFNWGYSIPKGNHHKREREEFLIVKATPDDYLIKHDQDGEEYPRPIIDMERFQSPGGEIKNLNKYLVGLYLNNSTIKNYGENNAIIQLVMNHPKYLGVLDDPNSKK